MPHGGTACDVWGSGVFVLTGGQQLEVVELPPPTDEQLGRILHKIARRSTALVHDYFGTLDDAQDLLGGAIYEAMTRLPRPAPDEDDEPEPERSGKRCAQLDGFSLHANTSVAADNRLALELHLVPPVARHSNG